MTEPEGQRKRGASPEETGGHAFVASGGHDIYIERQHSRSTESHDRPPVELDDSDYEEIREAIGRGAPTLLLGTSTRSLQRNLAKIVAAQRAEPEPGRAPAPARAPARVPARAPAREPARAPAREPARAPAPEPEQSQVELAVKGSSASYGRLLVLVGIALCIAFVVITVALGGASWWSRLAVSVPIFVVLPAVTVIAMRLMVHYTRVRIDDLPSIVREMHGHTIVIGDSSEKKEKHPVEASAKNHD